MAACPFVPVGWVTVVVGSCAVALSFWLPFLNLCNLIIQHLLNSVKRFINIFLNIFYFFLNCIKQIIDIDK